MRGLTSSIPELHSASEVFDMARLFDMARPGVAGFGQMLARPLFRERHRPDMSEEDAIKLLHEGLRVRYLDTCTIVCSPAAKLTGH